MLETSARLLRLLSLLQGRRFWSGAELSSRLEVTARTLRRDVDRLRSLGYPVQAASGVAGGYELGAGASLPPLLLEDDEALAVSIALGTAAGSMVTGIEEAALRALVKLEQVLPARLRRRVSALHKTIVPLQRPGPPIDSALLATLAAACRDREQLHFRYEAARDKRSSERVVEPQGLVHTGFRWYLVAWDVGRADFRTFRVDRIAGKIESGERFLPRPPPEGGDLRAYVSRSLGSAPYAIQARVILHAPLAVAAERVSPAAGALEALDEERCVLRTGGNTLASLAAWIAAIDLDFEVEEPQPLIDELRRLHARLGKAVEASQHESRPTS